MADRAIRDLLGRREFFFVAPLIAYGAWRQWRDRPRRFVVLAAWLGAVLLIHLPYEALRLRDLLSLYPVLCFWAGLGAVALGRLLVGLSAWSAVPPFVRAYACGLALVGLLVPRTGTTLSLWSATDANTFGRLNAFQRQGFQQLGEATESDALIGASLNSGAVELHAGRLAFRPAAWTQSEFYAFVEDALARGEPLYLLDDGLEMAATMSAARERYDVQSRGTYDVPFYHQGGGSTGGRVTLYRLRQRTGGASSE
jgi:hypothetical protein